MFSGGRLITDTLGITGGGGPYQPQTQQYETAARTGLFNRAGARLKPKKPGQNGPDEYDFSEIGKPIQGAEGIRQAAQPYNFGAFQRAEEGYNKPAQFQTTYKPTEFKGLPEQYYNMAYSQGAKPIQRQAADDLTRTREAVGVRRPGLLMKAAQTSQRDVGETLAGLQSQLRQKQMEQEYGAQKDQAAENQFAANFGFGKEKTQADERFRNLGALSENAARRIGLESDIVGREREYQDQALQYIMDLFKTGLGGSQAADDFRQKRQSAGLTAAASAIPK